MKTVKSYGLNFIRCHSYCPPEAAFLAADNAGVYLQPESRMWNILEAGNGKMPVLERQTMRVLEQFGHHPSFVLFSPSNEPGGQWYEPLKKWVDFARAYDKELGYENRRVYTAQSGWFFDVPPSALTSLPRKTSTFCEIRPYAQVFEIIIHWFQYGEYSLEKERLIRV